jgi:hypothetical protein
MMKKKYYFGTCFLAFMLVFAAGQRLDSSDILALDVGLGPYTATEQPFNSFPFVKLGFHHDLSRSLVLGGSLAFTRWSDYLNMFGGLYTFYCCRPAIELTCLFPASPSSVLVPLAGIGFGYNFYHIKNELGNAYPGKLKDHIFLTPYLGANFGMGEKARGIAKNVFLSAKLVWNMSHDFSGLHGSLGLNFKIN